MTSMTFFLIFAPLIATLFLVINFIFAPHNPYQEKNSPFECGFHSFLGQNRTQFSISFFIFALLFLLFDLEILLVYPYVVSAYSNGVYGLMVMLTFFLALTLGFAFELGKNALKIDSKQMQNLSNKSSIYTMSASIFLPSFLYFYGETSVLKVSVIVLSDLNKALYDLLVSIILEFNKICNLIYINVLLYTVNMAKFKYFNFAIYTYLYLSIFVLGSFIFDYAELNIVCIFILFTISIITLIYIYNNKYLLTKYPILSWILISISLIIIIYSIYTFSCLHLEILKDFILWAKTKFIKPSSSSNNNSSNNSGRPGPPKKDIKSMSPDAKKKHLKNRRRGMDEAYDRTEEGKARNEKYRSSEKEAISRKERNARSVAKRAVIRKQGEFDKRTQELETIIAAEYDDLKEARIQWYRGELAACETRLNEYKEKWEALKKEALNK